MKILILIISSQKFFDSRISFILETWLKDVDNYVIISDYCDTKFNTVKITDDSSYESNVTKNLDSFNFINKNYQEFDWFITLDDDTFLNYKNLKLLIETLPIDDIFMMGSINKGTFQSDTSLNYCSGGAGYLYNKKTMNILKNIDYTYNKSRFADVNVGFYCRDKNILLIDNPLFNPQKPSYYNCDEEKIKNAITFHYIFNEEFYNLYNIIK